MAPYSYSNYSGIGQYGYNPTQPGQPYVGMDAWNQFMPQPGPAAAPVSGTSSYAPSLAGYSAPVGPTMPAGATGAVGTTPYVPGQLPTVHTTGAGDPLAGSVYKAIHADPQKGMFEGLFKNEDGSLNMDFIGQLINGIGRFGSLALGFSANRQAKDAMRFQMDAYRTNLANSTKSYNKALEDQAYARAAQHGAENFDADAYIAKHRL